MIYHVFLDQNLGYVLFFVVSSLSVIRYLPSVCLPVPLPYLEYSSSTVAREKPGQSTAGWRPWQESREVKVECQAESRGPQ